jgi:U2 small nuclear ribonucleoprotein A'
MANNRISKLDADLSKYIPNLKSLVLNNNQICELCDLDPLMGFVKLEFLSLLDNVVVNAKHYRLYVIHRIRSVRILDFQKVKEKVRCQL